VVGQNSISKTPAFTVKTATDSSANVAATDIESTRTLKAL